MEPVISPWVFYWVSVLSNLSSALGFTIVFSLITAVIIGVVHICDTVDSYSDNLGFPNWRKYFILSMVICCICSIINIFIPSKETLIAMITASYITPDNINITTDYIVELVKKITEAVKEVK